MSQLWAKSEYRYDHEKIPIIELEMDIFPIGKAGIPSFPNKKKLSNLNFIWENFKQNQRTFLHAKKWLLPIWDFFSNLKKQNHKFSKYKKIYPTWTSSEKIWSKIRETFLLRSLPLASLAASGEERRSLAHTALAQYVQD